MSARRWRKTFQGQGLVEYSMVLLLVAIAVFTALALVGPVIIRLIQTAVDSFPA